MIMNQVYLADGCEIRAEVQRSSCGNETVKLEDRVIMVERLPPPYHYQGDGELVHIKLRNGTTLRTVLHPHEYKHHIANVPVGEIENTQTRRRYPGDIIIESKKSPSIMAKYDRVTKEWREMTDEEIKSVFPA
jgi:hypothetical protein